MSKTPTRFSVRKVKTCYRNSMIAGNPITVRFNRFGVFDKGWQKDQEYIRGFGETFVNSMNARKFRRVCQTETEAQALCDQMNKLWIDCGQPEMIRFNGYGDTVRVEATTAKNPWV